MLVIYSSLNLSIWDLQTAEGENHKRNKRVLAFFFLFLIFHLPLFTNLIFLVGRLIPL